jgi:ATP-dependent 26S proteasome regulatory subunit
MKMTFAEELVNKFKAGYPILAINSPEEDRCIQEITHAAWMMADGRRAKAGDQLGMFQSLKKDYENKIPVGFKIEGNEIEIQAKQMVAFLRHLGERADDRAELIENTLQSVGYPVLSWDRISGYDHLKGFEEDPVKAILAVITKFDPKQKLEKNIFPRFCVVVLKDVHGRLNEEDNSVRRALRTVFAKNRLVNDEIRRPIVFLQPDWTPHRDISHCVTLVDFDLPNEKQLDDEIAFVESSLQVSKTKVVSKCPAELRKDIVHALRGFTQIEAVNALSEGTVKHQGFSPEIVTTLHRIKAQTLKKDEVLEYMDADYIANVDDIGGYENYLEFVAECKECYTEEAMLAGLRKPKGVLLLGIPGTGKSMVGMATAKVMRLPLIKYDFGSVFGAHVGQSEGTQRNALRRITAQGPCVVLVDEADKAFAGMNQTKGDSGVGQRVFGRLLTWMATENTDAFIIMTMNRLEGVPIEMIRSGRMDKVFYTELPTPAERETILKIHMRKNNVDPNVYTKAEWKELAGATTDDFVGSELEQLVIHAVRIGWKARKKVGPTFDEIETARSNINPVSKLDSAAIEAIQQFCQDRATPVSGKKKTPVKATSGRARGSVLADPGSN